MFYEFRCFRGSSCQILTREYAVQKNRDLVSSKQRLAFLCGFRVFRSLKKPSDKTKKCRETRIMVSASETEKASKVRKQTFWASGSGENYGFSEWPSKGWQVKKRRNLTKLWFQRVTWWRMASQRKEKFDKIMVSVNDLVKDGKSKKGEIWQN